MADKLYMNLVLNVTRENKVILRIILKSHALYILREAIRVSNSIACRQSSGVV